MKQWKKGLSAMICAGLLAAVCAGSALAAEKRTPITSVKLNVESDIQAGSEDGEVTVTTDASTYTVDDVVVVNDEGSWSSGDIPKVEVTLICDDEYRFDNIKSKSKVSLKGAKATFVTSRVKNQSTELIITIKLGELEGTLEIEGVEWEDETSPVGRWEDTDGARSYQVRLYRNGSSVGSTETVTNETYNFASRITREGEYYFKVRAVNSNNKRGEWYESDYIYVDEEVLDDIKNGRYTNYSGSGSTSNTPGSTASAQWKRNNIGWWYEYADGTYPTNGWLLISNVWYCFDASGYMRTGWIQAGDGQYYYCDTNSGAMLTNTWTPDNYYVGANGVWDQSKRR
ncbi:MAG: hypothetical protein HFG62_08990 [Lachnospiraceae bacterium]|mgnify:CR=1 FL=1|jgi:hypothetical protein|nr:hypothetical protein [Lachnospiraceae bacterium]MCI8959239.1 hypothetical protein [Lachnospiraceae bacterium]